MPLTDSELLELLTARFLAGARNRLSPSERAELVRIAQGFACKDSAAATGLSDETVRARRKRIYRKLGVPGSHELVSSLLQMSLAMLATGERIPADGAPAPPGTPGSEPTSS